MSESISARKKKGEGKSSISFEERKEERKKVFSSVEEEICIADERNAAIHAVQFFSRNTRDLWNDTDITEIIRHFVTR